MHLALAAALLTAASALRPVAHPTPAQSALFATPIERRTAVQGLAAAGATALLPPPARAAGEAKLKTVEWSATDGFDSDFPSQINFIEFDEKAYKAMRDDPRRTPKFAKAIRARLAELGPDAVVLDLGTGPFCVLALIAATAGARKVYAVEANPEAARRARAFIAKCEAPDARRDGEGTVPLAKGLVEVIEGFSTALTLPEKADLCVFEICGSVASEEGLYATMRDAKARHLKRPDEEGSYIPRRCQTFAAPVSYALHNLLTPPSYDWSKLGKEPIRFNCRDEALQVLSPPQLLEDISFAGPLPALPATVTTKLSFPVTADAVAAARERYAANFAEERQLKSLLVAEDGGKMDPVAVAQSVATRLSGLAMWPTLVLDDSPGTLVRSRGANGEAQKSHWQTVLKLLADTPLPVAAGDAIDVAFDARLDKDVAKATTYRLAASVRRA